MSEELGVIFDVDGVLVDSYQAHWQSWCAIADDLGLPGMSEAQFVSTFGRTSREVMVDIWPGPKVAQGQFKELEARKEKHFRRIITQDYPAMPGARELIVALSDAGFSIAAGSSGPPANVDLALQHLGEQARFGAVVTAHDVTIGKPDPQVFLIAAEKLGLPPRRCAVVEDATVGITAANAAKMTSVALQSAGHSRQEYAQADHVVETLFDLSPETLKEWITCS